MNPILVSVIVTDKKQTLTKTITVLKLFRRRIVNSKIKILQPQLFKKCLKVIYNDLERVKKHLTQNGNR